MDIRELAEQQRRDARAGQLRRHQRNLSPIQLGFVTQTGVSINGSESVRATNLGGTVRLGQAVLVQSDGLNFWYRGHQQL